MVKWEYSHLSDKEIIYMFDELKSLSLVQTAKTVVVPRLKEEEKHDAGITGKVVKDEPKEGFSFDMNYLLIIAGIIIIAGLAVYYFFFLRIEDEFEQKAVGIKKKSGQRKIIGLADAERKRNKFAQVFGRIYSRVVSFRENPKTEHLASASDAISVALAKGNESINSLNLNQAYAYYLEALELLNAAGPKTRQHMGKAVQSLYYKIALCRKIQESHNHVDMQNHIKLSHSISAINALLDLAMGSAELDESNALLVKFALQSRDYFSDALKAVKPADWEYTNGSFE